MFEQLTKDMFPIKTNFTNVNTRYHENYEVHHALQKLQLDHETVRTEV